MSKTCKQTLGYLNCNPLNIRYTSAKWQGATGVYLGFVRFKDFAWGYRAAVRIFATYYKSGLRTLEEFIYRWAPPEENNTELYIKNVLEIIGSRTSEPYKVDRDTWIELSNEDFIIQLLLAMTAVEIGADEPTRHSLRSYAQLGYQLAAHGSEFFKK